MEKVLWEEFLLDTFLGEETHIPGRKIMGYPVKDSGLEILNSNQMAQGNKNLSCVVPGHIFAALHGRIEFRSGERAQLLTEIRTEIRRQTSHEARESLIAAVGYLSPADDCSLHRRHKTVTRISVVPSMVDRTKVGV